MSASGAVSAPAGYVIRSRRAEDDPLLVGVENRAAELFRDHGYAGIAEDPIANVEELRAMIGTNQVWVATTDADEPVGYAVAGRLGEFFHLRELSVDPVHGRRGIGAALVRTVIAAANAAEAAGISLTTFRSVPFNAPFYAKLGFSELPLAQAPRALSDAFRNELPAGIAESERVLMVRPAA